MIKNIELDKEIVKILEEKAKALPYPVKVKPYIEGILKKFAKDELIEIKRK